MWNITKEVKEKFQKCNLLPIYESDEDWEIALREAEEEGEDLIALLKDALAEVKAELLQVLPSRFIPYVENGILNQPTLPKGVREDYLKWVKESTKEFEQILDAAYEQTKQTVTYLSYEVQEVFAESLHDSSIMRINREANTLHLYINTDGGFSSKSLIHLMLHNVISEETDIPIQVGQYLIYNELQRIEDGYAFRMLFECPDAEWTVTIKEMDARYYYRPVSYWKLRDDGKIDETSVIDYVAQLNPEHRYWFITPDVEYILKSLSEIRIVEDLFGQMVITDESRRFSYNLDECNPIEFIYTDVYEDPYAQFKEPVPMEQIEEAAFSEDLDLQVRAWNTMHASPQELADIINRILWKMGIKKENEMMLFVYVSHFYKEGILTDAIIEKYRAVIE